MEDIIEKAERYAKAIPPTVNRKGAIAEAYIAGALSAPRKEIVSSQDEIKAALKDMVDWYQFFSDGYPEHHEMKKAIRAAKKALAA